MAAVLHFNCDSLTHFICNLQSHSNEIKYIRQLWGIWSGTANIFHSGGSFVFVMPKYRRHMLMARQCETEYKIIINKSAMVFQEQTYFVYFSFFPPINFPPLRYNYCDGNSWITHKNTHTGFKLCNMALIMGWFLFVCLILPDSMRILNLSHFYSIHQFKNGKLV